MKKTFIIFCLGLLAISCDQSLLDIPQQGVESEDSFYKTDEDCESALAATYQVWKRLYCGGTNLYSDNGWNEIQSGITYFNAFWFKCCMADEINSGCDRNKNREMSDITECCITPSNGWVESYYMLLYKTIYMANIVISKFNASDSAVKARDIAEAKFIRAFCYYDLITLWGEVPLVDRVLATAEEQQIAVSAENELWAFVEKDLADAIESGSLTSKSGLNDKSMGRISKEAARTLLAKCYLWQEKYEDARDQLEAVINSGLFGLEDDVKDFYHKKGNSSKEYILEMICHEDPANYSGQGGWYGIMANWMFAYLFKAGPEAASHYNFASKMGYASFHPTKSLYDAYVAEEGVNGWRLTRDIVPITEINKMNVAAIADNELYSNEGYMRLKWLVTADDEVDVTLFYGYSGNTPVYRYADVLLMMSEVSLKCGNTSDAEKYLNMVRTRAHLPNKSGITMEDIKTERRLELSMEGHRFQDLKRWGDAPTVLADKGRKISMLQIIHDAGNPLKTAEDFYNDKTKYTVRYIDNERSDAGWQDRDLNLPFPESEILVNRALVQKQGY
ncbi:MAG: RagB/SusD family nutrient uptake outer membrane protein [Bacteroidales bacterium]|nr:RagB/SusD family nutrient uptake outer membrane protein [Bacteroidales bacterium]